MIRVRERHQCQQLRLMGAGHCQALRGRNGHASSSKGPGKRNSPPHLTGEDTEARTMVQTHEASELGCEAFHPYC